MLSFEVYHKGYNNETYELPIHVFECISTLNNEPVCMCKVSVHKDKWSIASWYTKKDYINQGIGRQTLGYLFQYLSDYYEIPTIVEYIWDGREQYVYEWLQRNFDAKCWDPIRTISYIYHLDVTKTFHYFGVIQHLQSVNHG